MVTVAAAVVLEAVEAIVAAAKAGTQRRSGEPRATACSRRRCCNGQGWMAWQETTMAPAEGVALRPRWTRGGHGGESMA